MMRALDAGLGGAARWNPPIGGVFLWLELPAGVSASAMARVAAQRERVACVPSAAFDLGRPEIDDAVRLNFSCPSPATIEEGIARLSRAVRALIPSRGIRTAG
jgi:2-aminoadipate transaminase